MVDLTRNNDDDNDGREEEKAETRLRGVRRLRLLGIYADALVCFSLWGKGVRERGRDWGVSWIVM